jgi:hypothetical protein
MIPWALYPIVSVPNDRSAERWWDDIWQGKTDIFWRKSYLNVTWYTTNPTRTILRKTRPPLRNDGNYSRNSSRLWLERFWRLWFVQKGSTNIQLHKIAVYTMGARIDTSWSTCNVTPNKLDVHGSVNRNVNLIERTNKMRPCSRIYYSSVSYLLDMFRATHLTSSGAQKL